MDLLVPAHEVWDPLLDADLGPVVELALRAPQVGRRQPHVPRLVGVSLDAYAPPQGPPDQLDQPVQPHPRTATDVERFGAPARARTAGPLHGGKDAGHAVRNIGIVALARPVAVHPHRLALSATIPILRTAWPASLI